ncbi:MAG: glycosyltransferase family 1 protein [Spirochaetia bacterium]|jgi:glycosyltransferase involved in cell wall biosynthesis
MMRVLYDYQAFLQRRGGVSRYFAELIGALSRMDGFEATFPVIFSDNEYLEKRRFLLTRRHFKGKIRIMAALNRFSAVRALRTEYEVFHPTYYRPYFLRSIQRPFVVTVHDMIHELYPEHVRDDGTAANKRLLCNRASLIIAVSANTKKDLCRLLDIAPEKVTVIPHATSLTFNGSPRMVDRPYLLYVGERSGYKNFETFLQAAALLLPRHDLELVCAGGGNFSRVESGAFRQHGIIDRVRYFTTLSSAQLANLYHFASVFVYPSLYEGFGMPLLEAFACGCPVAASASSSIPEVAGEAAELFDPRSIDSVASAVEKVLCSPSRSRQLVEAGAARLTYFSWQKAAAQTLEVYKKAS